MKILDVSRSASAGAAALTCVMGAVAAALAVCAPAAGAVATRPAGSAGETVVRLYATAVVTDDDVRLADVAELDGDAAKLAGSWAVAPSPHVGGVRVIDLDAVQRAMAGKGVNLSQWVFRGSSRCTVSRPKNCIAPASGSTDERAADIEGARGVKGVKGEKGEKGVKGVQGAVKAGCSDLSALDPNSLEAVLRAHVGRKAAELGGVPLIRFSPVVSKALALARPQYEFAVTDRVTQPLGMVSVEVAISEQGEVVQTLPMLVHVSMKKSVVVSARAINRSQRIEPDDLTLGERTFDRIEDVGMSDASPLIGQQARRPIERGEQLSLKDVEPVPLVQRNDLVTVWVRRGGVSVKSAAKAMGTACYGQMVTLKNEASNQTFAAVVTGPRTTEVLGEDAAMEGSTTKEQAR